MAIRIQPVRAALAVNLFSLAAMALSDRVLCTIRRAPSFAQSRDRHWRPSLFGTTDRRRGL